MKKKKVLEDKKKELDEQAAAALAAKKSKLQKETLLAPSESEIDMGVFRAKHGNLLKKIFAASGSQGTKFFACLPCYLSSVFTFDYRGFFVIGVKSGKAPRKVDISMITPLVSPPSRTFGMSHPHPDRGKRKEGDMEVEQVVLVAMEVVLRVLVVMQLVKVLTPMQNQGEATPRHTIYTKVVRGSGQGGASGTHHSPEYEHVQGGSWDTHNPACADLPHATR
ncbi:hypothetical protein Hanom_Chr14g01261351 [Helianthus anomalus]